MNDSYGNYPIKRIYILDLFSFAISFFAALMIRYREQFTSWHSYYDGLYINLLIVIILLQTVVFLVFDARHRSIFRQDPVENLISVFKSRTVIMVLLIFYLYATQRGELSSRFIIVAIYVLAVLTDYVFRMVYRSRYRKQSIIEEAADVLELYHPYPSPDGIRELAENGDYTEVLIHPTPDRLPDSSTVDSVARACEDLGLRTFVALEPQGRVLRAGMVSDVADCAAYPASIRTERYDVFGVKYAISGLDEAVMHVIRHLKDLSGRYICFSNVHTLVMARENPEYRDALNGSAITFPDGAPIAQMEMRSGISGAERVAGPDFMNRMFTATADGSVRHYFYGSSPETLDALKNRLQEKYPDMVIAGMYSPPYRDLTAEEDEEIIRTINDANADIVWIGLGAPKQEKWMAAHNGLIHGVMMGVGAGFDFHAGTIRRAPVWIQRIGLEWLYRLFQDPKRLIRRYLVTNVKFYWYRIIKKITHRG